MRRRRRMRFAIRRTRHDVRHCSRSGRPLARRRRLWPPDVGHHLDCSCPERAAMVRICGRGRQDQARGDFGSHQAGSRQRGRARATPPPDETPLERFFRRFGQPDDDTAPAPRSQLARQGAGFFISPDGYAVTNNHVVDGVKTVEVTTDDGKIHTARVIGADERTDIALIKVDGRSDFPTAKFSASGFRASATGCSRSATPSGSAAP